jgi:hypothetical protein
LRKPKELKQSIYQNLRDPRADRDVFLLQTPTLGTSQDSTFLSSLSLFSCKEHHPTGRGDVARCSKANKDRLGRLHRKCLASYDKKKRTRTSPARFNPRDSAAKMPRDLACWGPRLGGGEDLILLTIESVKVPAMVEDLFIYDFKEYYRLVDGELYVVEGDC